MTPKTSFCLDKNDSLFGDNNFESAYIGLFPEEEDGRRPRESESTMGMVLGRSLSAATATIRVDGAFPLDIDWRYYLVIRLGRVASPGSDYNIRVAVQDVDGGEVLFEHVSPAADLLPDVNTVSTLLFGPLTIPEDKTIEVAVSTYQVRGEWHSGLV